MCEGGCVGGPSQHRSEMQFKKDRDTLIAEADDRGVHENLESVDMEAFAMHRQTCIFAENASTLSLNFGFFLQKMRERVATGVRGALFINKTGG